MEQSESPRSGSSPVEESPTIFLVDDEEGVRDLARGILQQAGYYVVEAANGAVALDAARRFKGPIDVLITDLVMPSMNGRELARRLSMLRPGLRVLYMSAHVPDKVARGAIEGEAAAFLPKPFSPAVLTATVRELLEKPGDREG